MAANAESTERPDTRIRVIGSPDDARQFHDGARLADGDLSGRSRLIRHVYDPSDRVASTYPDFAVYEDRPTWPAQPVTMAAQRIEALKRAITLMIEARQIVEANGMMAGGHRLGEVSFSVMHGLRQLILHWLRHLPPEEYYRTDHWQAARYDALERAGHACFLCHAAAHLQVHHRTYERLGLEDPDDLVVLCDACHARHHGKLPRWPNGDGTDPATKPFAPDGLVSLVRAGRPPATNGNGNGNGSAG